MKFKKWDKVAEVLPPLSEDEERALKESISKDGVKYPILVLPDGRIIDGYHRWILAPDPSKVPYQILDLSENDAFILALNLNYARRHLGKDQFYEIKKAFFQIKEATKEAAYQLKEKGETLERISEILKVSPSTLSDWIKEKQKEVEEGEITPKPTLDLRVKVPKQKREEIYQKYKKDELTMDELAAEYKISKGRISQIISKVEEEKQKKKPSITKFPVEEKYRCIVINPYAKIPKSRIHFVKVPGSRKKEIEEVLTEIKELKIQDLINPSGCHIYFWIHHELLEDALEFFKDWGAKYHCILTWKKKRGVSKGWVYHSEHCLVGVVGNLPFLRKGISVIFETPTEKVEEGDLPDRFYGIVKTMSPEPRLDVYSRAERDRFDTLLLID